jgi:hypothetical protein
MTRAPGIRLALKPITRTTGRAFEAIQSVVDPVLPIDLGDVQRARSLLGTPSLQARDASTLATRPFD